jgi:3-oxoacyl-[acyl-carrier protein] reductase
MNTIDLQGRTAVVTGGCRGIGLAVARRFLASGARVMIWDIDPRALDAAQAELPALATHRVDVTAEAGVAAAVAAALAELGRIDILVNAAGIAGARIDIVDCTLDEWRRVIDINLTGTFLCCRDVARHMRATGYGRIINLSSIAGKDGNATAGHYSASKAGVMALTKSLAKELLAGDIRVNALAPAAIETELFAGMPPEKQKVSLSRIPLGRAGRTDEAAAIIAWMASAECSFTTGFTFDLSGGRATY